MRVRRRNPVAVIECHQEIPCNPCELICPNKAIVIGSPITTRPRFFADRCTGCGKCIPFCPGLAIFLFDPSYSEEEALVGFPHEYLPLARKGQVVEVVDRQGRVLGKGKVIKIDSKVSNDRTPVIHVAVSKTIGHRVRGMVRLSKGGDGD